MAEYAMGLIRFAISLWIILLIIFLEYFFIETLIAGYYKKKGAIWERIFIGVGIFINLIFAFLLSYYLGGV